MSKNNQKDTEQHTLHIVSRSLWLRFSDWIAKSTDEEECERNRVYGLCDHYTKEQRQECKNRINGVC